MKQREKNYEIAPAELSKQRNPYSKQLEQKQKGREAVQYFQIPLRDIYFN
jgi:hypothetical protein